MESLENLIGIRSITNKREFDEMLQIPKAIIYILANWSGQERNSRSVVYSVLNTLKITDVPIFKIDCSEQDNRYVEDWLDKLATDMKFFYSNGYGETLLVSHGIVIDFIKYPADLGVENTRLKIKGWIK